MAGLSLPITRWKADVLQCVPVAVLGLMHVERAAASLIVDRWEFRCTLTDPSGAGTGFSDTVVVNPFVVQRQATYGIATNSVSYNVGFDSQSFDEYVTASITAPGSVAPFYTSSCTGYVIIRSSNTPLQLTFDSSYAWQLPGGDRSTLFTLVVNDATTYYVRESAGSIPAAGGPPVGSVSPSGSVLLPANNMYRLLYLMELDSQSGNPNVLSHGDGYVHFHLQAVPEASPFVLMMLGGLALRRRRARRA